MAQVRGYGNAEQIRQPCTQHMGARSDANASSGLVLVQVLLHGGGAGKLSISSKPARTLDLMGSRRTRMALLS
jgi:hypothetical protein